MIDRTYAGRISTRVAVLLAAMVVSALLPGCRNAQSGGGAITFGCFASDVTLYQLLADEFHQLHPEITVYVREVDDAFDSSRLDFTLKVLAGRVDTFVWYNMALDQARRLDLLLDLQPFMEEGDAVEADYRAGLLDAFGFEGGLWGLPTYVDPLVMFYDRSALDQAGIGAPKKGWSWEDFISLAEELTLEEDDQTTRYGFVDVNGLLPLALVYQHGDSLLRVETESDLLVPVLQGGGVAESFEWYAALAREHGVMPGHVDSGIGEAATLVTSGQAAMWAANLSTLQIWRTSRGLSSVGIASLPEDLSAAHPLLAAGYSVSAGTANPNAAWQWIEYLSRQVVATSAGQDMVPCRLSVAEAQQYWDQLGEAAVTVSYVLDNSLTQPGLWELWRVVSPVAPLVQGELSAAEFLADAQQRANAWQADRAAVGREPIVVATPSTSGRGEGIIVHGVTSERLQVHYEALAQGFTETHPDVHLEVVDVSAGESMVDLALMADSADVFLRECLTEMDYVDPESPPIVDLAPLIDADVDFSSDDYVPWLVAPGQAGVLWGLPVALDARVVYYDRAVFDEIGTEYPKADWSWDDLLFYAGQVTTGDDPYTTYGFLSDWLPMEIYLYLESYDIHLVERQDGGYVYSFDSDAVEEAIQWWVDLDRQHGVMPRIGGGSGARDYELVRNGRVAMWSDLASDLDTPWLYGPDRQLGVLPLPRGDSTVASVESLCLHISAQAADLGACWEWIRYLSKNLPPGYLAPVRTSQLSSSAFRMQVGDEMAIAYLRALEADSRSDPYDWPGPLLLWLEEALEEIANGRSVDAALSDAQAKAELYSNR